MANPIANAQDLKDVLDAIYTNSSQYDTYQNLTLYYNDITRTATIFTVDEEDEENTKNVIAVFNPENVVTQDNAFFVTLMKSATVNVSTEETSVYDFALGGYVNVDTLLKNICVALGVSLSGTFADANPSLYNDMINIIRNEYGQALENNAPYIMKKFVNLDTQEESYKSLVPLMCIVKIAIYLNNLGIFNEGNFKYKFGGIKSSAFDLENSLKNLYALLNLDYPTYNYLQLEICSKNEFKERVVNTYLTNNYIDATNNQRTIITNGLNAFDRFLDQYENEINWDNYLRMVYRQTTSSATNTETIQVYEMPIDKVLEITYLQTVSGVSSSTSMSKGNIAGTGISHLNSTTGSYRFNSEDNITLNRYTLTVSRNNTTQEDTITHNKEVYTLTKQIQNLSIASGDYINNLKSKEYIKGYLNKYISTSSPYNEITYPFNSYDNLVVNTTYDLLNYITDEKYFIPYIIKKILEKDNIDLNIGDNDLVLCLQSLQSSLYKFKIIIIRNVSDLIITDGLDNRHPLYNSNQFTYYPVEKYRYPYNSDTFYEYDLLQVWVSGTTGTVTNNNKTVYFNETNIDEYDIDIEQTSYNPTGNYTINNNTTVANYYTAPNNYTNVSNNLGELVQIEEESTIDGLSLIDGATYPKNVIDLNSFNEKYPNWWKTQSNNPQIIDGVLAPTVTSTQWGAVAISNTTPTTQEDADSGDIDFTDTELIDDIVDDVDNAAEDQDVPPSDPNENGIEDEGESPDDTLERVRPQLLQGGFIKQYAMNGTQMQTFADAMNNPDIIQTLQRLVNNPIEAIISLQVGYIYNDTASIANEVLQINGLTWASLTNSPTGTRLNNNIIEGLDFGMIQVPLEYHTYQDYTTTTLQLYLPFVGFIHLDVNEFMGHQLDLVGSIDTLTGSILYVVSSYKDGQRRELYQFQGNCQQQVPLNQKDNTQLLTGMMQLGATALTGGVMMGAGGAALNTANAIAGNIENPNLNILKPNITHGGSVGGNVGLLGNMIPYAFVERKQIYDPKHEIIGEVQGLPANSSVVLGSLKGYTVVKDVIVKTAATQDENNEIERLLKEGVIL